MRLHFWLLAGCSFLDRDGDGLPEWRDCDDRDPAVGESRPAWIDRDGDGLGGADRVDVCAYGDRYAPEGGDCDDADASVGGPVPQPADADGDGFQAYGRLGCGDPVEIGSPDCDDQRADVHPGAPEVACNGVDEDCSGRDDPPPDLLWWPDRDGDGWGDDGESGTAARSCELWSGWSLAPGDCEDGDATVSPGAPETCDERDEDCDGLVDDGTAHSGWWYADADGDGWGGGALQSGCVPPWFAASVGGDCASFDPSVHPLAVEVSCNRTDDDCDGVVDETDEDSPVMYVDADGDGAGAGPPVAAASCVPPEGYASRGDDCDDGDPWIGPRREEVCDDGVDADCSGADCRASSLDDGSIAEGVGLARESGVAGVVVLPDADGDGADELVAWHGAEARVYAGYPDAVAVVATWTASEAPTVAVTHGGDGARLWFGLPGQAERVVLLSGDARGALTTSDAIGEVLGDACRFSPELVAPGDLDGDGAEDLVVADDCDGDRARVLFAPEGGTRRLDDLADGYDGNDPEVAALGDVTGDGAPDLAVVDPWDDLAHVFDAPPSGFVGARDAAAVLIGHTVGAGGDLDGDGYGDVLGEGEVWFGPFAGQRGSADAFVEAGHLVALGDVDGDGFGDVAASDEDRVGVLFGPIAGTVPADAGLVLTSARWTSAWIGHSLAAGDLDGDGGTDLAVRVAATGISRTSRDDVFVSVVSLQDLL